MALIGTACGAELSAEGQRLSPARELELPTLKAGEPCERTAETIDTSNAIRPGGGPISAMVSNTQVQSRELIKVLWSVAPSYRGPVRIRGGRLDMPGNLLVSYEGISGTGPLVREVDHNGVTYKFFSTLEFEGMRANESSRIRAWPTFTYVDAPGCYAWIVEALGFTSRFFFTAVLT
jgi:hypothetical protein